MSHVSPSSKLVTETDTLLAVTAAGGEALLSANAVRQLVGGVSNATLYRMIASKEFPRPVAVTPGRKAWPMSAVQAWIRDRIEHAQEIAATSSKLK